MKIFGIEIRRSRLTDEIKTSMPNADDKTKATPSSNTIVYHMGVLYAKVDEIAKQVDINRRDIAATQKATYRRPPISQELQEALVTKQKENKVRTGDPYVPEN